MTPRQLNNGEPVRFDYAAGICSGGCTDLDMVWERRGRFLLIENKQPGESIPKGQLITLRELERQGWTVWVVIGCRPEVIVAIALGNCISVLRELPDSEWRDVCTRIADLLEQQAHEEAA